MDLGRHRLYVRLRLCASLIVYQLGGLITGEVGFGVWSVIALALLAGVIYLLVRPAPKLDAQGRLSPRAVPVK